MEVSVIFIYQMIRRCGTKEELDDVVEILGELQAAEQIDVDEDMVTALDDKAHDLELKARYLECQ